MSKRLRNFGVGFLVTLAGVATAATFNLFQPATGILKGNSSTYITTAATSSDIVSTFSGTCNSGAVLKGDGTCAPAATGSVTSVALTMPTGFSVSGSPVTSSGTLGVTTALNGPVRGNGSGLITGNTSLTTEVSGILPVANGGTGVGTLTGIALGNGTSPFSAAASSNVISLWSGTCNSSSFLRGDGSCASPGGGGTVTSITAGTGLAASPGSPITSSGTLSVDQATNWAWTGTASHTQAITSTATASALSINGTGADTNVLVATTTSGNPYYRATAFGVSNWSFGMDRASGDWRLCPQATLTSCVLTQPSAGPLNTIRGGDEQLRLGGVSGATNPYLSIYNASGSRVGYYQFTNSNSSFNLVNEVSGGGILLTTTGGGAFNFNGNTVLTSASSLNAANLSGTVGVPVSTTTGAFSSSLTVAGANVCRSTGVNCPAASVPRAGARISGGGGCTIAGTAFGVGSCSRSSAGIYQINFSGAGFSDSPACAITQEIAGAATMVYTVFAINAVSLNVRSAAGVGGTLTDSNFNITCTGF